MPKGGVQASAYRRMKEISDLLNEELTKHFSLQVDLQVYEDCDVVLDSGEVRVRVGTYVTHVPTIIMANLDSQVKPFGPSINEEPSYYHYQLPQQSRCHKSGQGGAHSKLTIWALFTHAYCPRR